MCLQIFPLSDPSDQYRQSQDIWSISFFKVSNDTAYPSIFAFTLTESSYSSNTKSDILPNDRAAMYSSSSVSLLILLSIDSLELMKSIYSLINPLYNSEPGE